MRRIRFTIASLLVVVLFVAVGFAALRKSSDLWESGVFTLTLAALLISILLAVHRTESRRAFWLGFALFGWTYLGLSLVPSIESRLISTKAFAYLDSKLAYRSVGGFSVRSSATNSGIPSNQVQAVAFTPDGNQFATSSQGVVEILGCADRQAAGRLDRHNRELHSDRTLALVPDRRNLGWSTFSPSIRQESGLDSRARPSENRNLE